MSVTPAVCSRSARQKLVETENWSIRPVGVPVVVAAAVLPNSDGHSGIEMHGSFFGIELEPLALVDQFLSNRADLISLDQPEI